MALQALVLAACANRKANIIDLIEGWSRRTTYRQTDYYTMYVHVVAGATEKKSKTQGPFFAEPSTNQPTTSSSVTMTTITSSYIIIAMNID